MFLDRIPADDCYRSKSVFNVGWNTPSAEKRLAFLDRQQEDTGSVLADRFQFAGPQLLNRVNSQLVADRLEGHAPCYDAAHKSLDGHTSTVPFSGSPLLSGSTEFATSPLPLEGRVAANGGRSLANRWRTGGELASGSTNLLCPFGLSVALGFGTIGKSLRPAGVMSNRLPRFFGNSKPLTSIGRTAIRSST